MIELTGFVLLSLLPLGEDASAQKTRASLRLSEDDETWEFSGGPVVRFFKPTPVEADSTFGVLAEALV